MKKILFISHDASRTGAPIVLLNFLGWLKVKNKFGISILLLKSGPLQGDFEKLAPTYLPSKKNLLQRLKKKVASKLEIANDHFELPGAITNTFFDLIYINTVACLYITPLLKKVFKCPVICHVHENEYTLNYHFSENVIGKNWDNISSFIAVSRSTKDNLINQYAIGAAKINLVYDFISLEKTKKQSLSVAAIKGELGLSNEFIIGGSGVTSWRKGVDLFVQLALILKEFKLATRVKLLWIGQLTHEFECQFNYEASRLGISDLIIFAGAKAIPQNYFQLFDVFVLSSREDPFPLVALEAAALNKPIICFDNSGGMAETITHGKNGLIVPYADVKEMASVIIQLMDNTNKRLEIGKAGAELLSNFDVNIAGEQILQIIEELIVNC